MKKLNFFIIIIAVNCGTNEEFALKAECPKTCLDPKGENDCGIKAPIEGCYCKEGFVTNAAGKCVSKDTCGCKLPDGSAIIDVGQKLTNADCTSVFTCEKALTVAVAKPIKPCGDNAVCTIVNNEPSCTCKPGFFGNGKVCNKDICNADPNPCGTGATCTSKDGIPTCTCPKGKTGDPKVRCCGTMNCQ